MMDITVSDMWVCCRRRHMGWLVVVRKETSAKVRIAGISSAGHLRKATQWLDKPTFLANFWRVTN